jgi:hypothetical protein
MKRGVPGSVNVQKLPQQNHFIFVVAAPEAGPRHARLVRFHRFDGAPHIVGRFYNAGTEEFRQKRQLIGGETGEKSADARPHGQIGAGGQRRHQSMSGTRPVRNHTEWLSRIMSNSAGGRNRALQAGPRPVRQFRSPLGAPRTEGGRCGVWASYACLGRAAPGSTG